MLLVFQFFRAAAAIGTHPGEALSGGDVTAKRRREMNAVVQFALHTLRDKSPVGGAHDPHPGLYRDSHTLFVNGNDVADLSSWNPGDVIHIANAVPYSLILELGGGIRVPHHTYELTEQAVQGKYGDIARIELAYMPIRFTRGQQIPATSRTRNGGAGGRLNRQPTLVIRDLG